MLRFRTLPRLSFATLLVVISVTVPSFGSATAEGAQVTSPADLARTSAVATPFIGTYEVWCTERNPGVTCINHHTSPAIDVGMAVGTTIYATGDGVVVEVEASCRAFGCRGGAGLFVEIGHADGKASRYLHLDQTFVEVGDEVTVGQVVGTSGTTGQASSPHIHYDEKDAQYPFGSRTPFGPWLSCIDGEPVQYPDVLGFESWNDVPFGTTVTNEGYECLGGTAPVSVEPLLFSGVGVLGLAATHAQAGTDFEVELTITEGDANSVATYTVSEHSMTRIATTAGTGYSARMRARIGGTWSAFSTRVIYTPDQAADLPTCRGLYASADAGSSDVDVLIGTSANDVLNGQGSDDIICGRGGNDQLFGGDGNDYIDGGDGNDRIDGAAGRDRLFGGNGRDRITGGSRRDIINGGNGPDTIFGGSGRDLLRGGMGNDTIGGGHGRDRINGGSGADDISGGKANDVVIGGAGHDVLSGNNGRDRLFGGNGDDSLFGGGGNDQLFGQAGLDSLDGGIGSDRWRPRR